MTTKPSHDWQAMREHLMAVGAAMEASSPAQGKIECAQMRNVGLQVDIGIMLRREGVDYGLSGIDVLRTLGLIVGSAIVGAFEPDDPKEMAPALVQCGNAFADGLMVAINSAIRGGESEVVSAELNLEQFKAQ